MRALIGLLVVAAACEPSDEGVPWPVLYTITGTVSGGRNSSAGPIEIALGDADQQVLALSFPYDGPFEFKDLPDHTAFRIVPPPGCVFGSKSAPSFGIIDGESKSGIEIMCDGFVSLNTLIFSAPLDGQPGFSVDAPSFEVVGSLLTQDTLTGVSASYSSSRVDVRFDGTPLMPVSSDELLCRLTSSCYGPHTLGDAPHVLSFTVTTSLAPFTQRTYTAAVRTDAAPLQIGFGKPLESRPDRQYGNTIAISDEYLAVSVVRSGSFYGGGVIVYEQAGPNWGAAAGLSFGNTAFVDRVGESIAINGDKILVGAPGKDGRGAVYLFRRIPDAGWARSTLPMLTPAPGDELGAAVAFVGDDMLVGAPGENGGAGGVWLLRGDGSAAIHFTAPNAGPGDRFGASVLGSYDRFMVGAPGEASSATTLAGDNNDALDAGALYVFHGAAWSQVDYLKAAAPSANAAFGTTIASSTNLIAIGAPGEASDTGAVYVFGHASPWSQLQVLYAPHPNAGDRYGASLTLVDRVLAIGAPFEDSAAAGVGGDDLDRSSPDAGAAYIYAIDAASREVSTAAPYYIKASNPGPGDLFGASIALSQHTLAVGAPFEDSGVTGTAWNGPQNDSLANSGAVYTFR